MSPRPLPAPDHPDAPKYWRHETGGALRVAIETYLHGHLMTVREVALMRTYLSQWIESPVWDMNPALEGNPRGRAALSMLRIRARRIATVADIHRWIHDALDEGIDPL